MHYSNFYATTPKCPVLLIGPQTAVHHAEGDKGVNLIWTTGSCNVEAAKRYVWFL